MALVAAAYSLSSPLHFLLFSALLFCGLSTCCCSQLRSRGKDQGVTHHVVDIRTLKPDDACSPSRSGPKHGGLTVVHRHGPCHSRGESSNPSPEQILLIDESRAESLRRQGSQPVVAADQQRTNRRAVPRSSTATSLNASLGVELGTANYVVKVGFGTPRKDLSVVFDTGSDLTWIQCKPCAGYCYSQKEPLFDPARSSTYQNISCSSTECSSVQSATGFSPVCSGSNCLYAIQYGDNSYSVGFLARETISLTPRDKFTGVRFGCGEKNRGLFGKAAGLLGLGRDAVSLVSQASSKYGRIFSYCLPSTSSYTGYLSMGPDASAAGVVTLTPMLSVSSMPSFYFIDMVGISVGGRQLPIPPTVFKNAGTVMDSGTVITRLPPDAYSVLRTAFRRGMSNYPTAPSATILDTCYDLSSYRVVRIPAVSLLFRGGASLDVHVSGILYLVTNQQSCLAFANNSSPSSVAIVGNMQQKTYKVIYDAAKGEIGFRAGGCS